jgi:predicted enzyme related to lactoylglutathione lyase
MSRKNAHSVRHFEIPADNVESLKDFYSSLFGWQFEKGQTQGYWIIKMLALVVV